jgi:Arc/MetJ-type ribon-helix-helix transcriptional regulator
MKIINFKGSKELKEEIRQVAFKSGYDSSSAYIRETIEKDLVKRKTIKK